MHSLPDNPGLLKQPFDPRDIWEDEVFAAGAESVLPKQYRIEDLEFEPQGSSPFCVSYATTKMAEWQLKYDKDISRNFSQPHLFYHSGGSVRGSYFRANLGVAVKQGLISERKMPLEDPYSWTKSRWLPEHEEAMAIPFKNIHKPVGYVRIHPSRDELKKAILDYGPVLVGVAASGGYWKDKQKRSKSTDSHAVLLVGWDVDDSWWVFDSLQPRTDFDGYHRLHSTYMFNSAHVLTPLPEDWREIVEEERKAPKNNENRYGLNRNYPLELKIAQEMLEAFEKFDNQSVMDASGRFWEMYIRAVAYGGYNLSYKKWGRWMSGDIVNDCYFWRRTGKHIFDFNKFRSEHK